MPADVADDRLRRFGYHLRQLREQRSMTQTGLAEASGLHVTYISGLERGRRNPSLLTMLNLAEALGSPIGELLRVYS